MYSSSDFSISNKIGKNNKMVNSIRDESQWITDWLVSVLQTGHSTHNSWHKAGKKCKQKRERLVRIKAKLNNQTVESKDHFYVVNLKAEQS